MRTLGLVSGIRPRCRFHGNGDFAHQITLFAFVPAGEGTIATAARSVGMGGGFDGAPIVSGGKGQGVNAVHNAFVMGGCPIGVSQCKVVG